MKNTELEIVHANNIASIIINTEPHELKHKIEVYKKSIKDDLEKEVESLRNSLLILKNIKETQTESNESIKEEIDISQQFFFVMFGLFLLFGSVMFAVGIYKTLTQ
ncbi:hypothetical protein [Empedobacter sp.]|uniref:hypothetical protein n=1 Tax=Empedobacter sp. TaxID=1927715 RepID=UPI0028AB6F9F|nr:hypothetical protein [Empedobacter sp.]